MRNSLILCTLVFALLSPSSADEGFKKLFDGKSLTGWRGDKSYWRVVDGTIVGDTKPTGMQQNTFLIADGEYADFVLRVKCRLVNGASGIQFRSRSLNDKNPNSFQVTGYQADIDYGGSMGEFYEEKGRGVLVRADAEVVERHVNKSGWNAFEIQMIGGTGVIRVNGRVTSRYVEKDDTIPRTGFVALQLQAGNGMEIAFKDIEIRELGPPGVPWKSHIIDDSSQGADGVKLADVDGDGTLDIAVGWEEGGVTRVYLNPGPKDSKSQWPAVTVGKTPSGKL